MSCLGLRVFDWALGIWGLILASSFGVKGCGVWALQALWIDSLGFRSSASDGSTKASTRRSSVVFVALFVSIA